MTSLRFFLEISFQLIPETRSLSADCLPSHIKASACGVSASQHFAGVWQISQYIGGYIQNDFIEY
jgi:hypothetical protein